MPEKKNPVDFGDLIARVMPPPVPSALACRPMVGSATELSDEGQSGSRRLWVIVHTITRSGMRLFHSRPLRGHKLAVRIDTPGGESVNVTLAVHSTVPHGQLFETTASFSH